MRESLSRTSHIGEILLGGHHCCKACAFYSLIPNSTIQVLINVINGQERSLCDTEPTVALPRTKELPPGMTELGVGALSLLFKATYRGAVVRRGPLGKSAETTPVSDCGGMMP